MRRREMTAFFKKVWEGFLNFPDKTIDLPDSTRIGEFLRISIEARSKAKRFGKYTTTTVFVGGFKIIYRQIATFKVEIITSRPNVRSMQIATWKEFYESLLNLTHNRINKRGEDYNNLKILGLLEELVFPGESQGIGEGD